MYFDWSTSAVYISSNCWPLCTNCNFVLCFPVAFEVLFLFFCNLFLSHKWICVVLYLAFFFLICHVFCVLSLLSQGLHITSQGNSSLCYFGGLLNIHTFEKFKKTNLWGNWVAQSVKGAILRSGHDLTIREFEPHVGLCADSSEPGACFRFSASPTLCPSLLTLCLSLSLSTMK